jgi:hypothetical protein
MHIETRHPLPARLHSLAAMAGLLERLERHPTPSRGASAEQYQGVARQVSRLLSLAEPDALLHQLLDAAPATAEIYENLRYSAAGLCRSPLERALNAELAASAVIVKARARA